MSDPKISKIVGKAIRKRREAAGLTQRAVARALKITDSNVSQYENGLYAPNLSRLRQLGRILGCKVSDLVEGL
jgi:transcriptional regulator with XRE-family HTH domain